ncbi:MAG: hypothetical protein KGY43_08100, partial [Halodesulfurarchaeum sp.]|nr:hypothetical protein [Halodesulfurarchaeum sp.]
WKPPELYDDPELERSGHKQPAEIEGPVASIDKYQFEDEAQVFTLRGEAYADDISVLQMYRGKVLTLRHENHSGKVYIEAVRATSTDQWDEITEFRMQDDLMQDVTEEKQVYTYSVDLIQVEAINADSSA